jgi:hypothetical protein
MACFIIKEFRETIYHYCTVLFNQVFQSYFGIPLQVRPTLRVVGPLLTADALFIPYPSILHPSRPRPSGGEG